MPDVLLDEIRTTDARPTAPPHTISSDAAFDEAVVAFRLQSDLEGPYLGDELGLSDDEPLLADDLELADDVLLGGGLLVGAMPSRAYRFKLGGTGPSDGIDLGSRGVICGAGFDASPLLRCGELVAWRTTPLVEVIDFSEAAPAGEGEHVVHAYANAEGQGWGG